MLYAPYVPIMLLQAAHCGGIVAASDIINFNTPT
jgi:hypothetical protein